MATTKIKYSPSVNIIRDNDYVFNYIPTLNAVHSFTTILNDTLAGTKSHTLIGAYGTGKSSFLLSFKQTLEGKFLHFKGHQKLLNNIPDYEFIAIVGEYASFENHFAKAYGLGKGYTSSDIIKSIDKQYKALKKKGKGLAILVDEFGKFLEYAAKHNPESELYFIQQLAEWVNDSNNDTLLITTLHQDFSAYSVKLSKSQRQEWDKVRGRLKDVTFNEPVEQLLFLASQRIDEKFPQKQIDKNFDKLFNTIKDAKAFPLRDYFEKDFAKKLYPFDILSAAVLTLSLQKYGQNERSLFSFIESNDYLGINEFDNTSGSGYFSIAHVYDYLLNGYYSFLNDRSNKHSSQWAAIRTVIEKLEGLFSDYETQKNAGNIIKTLGLLNIFTTGSAKLGLEFYTNYAKYAWGMKNAEEVIDELVKKKIIKYVQHSFRYVLFGNTDLDIDLAIDNAGKLVEKVTSVVNYLNQYFEFPFISAKSVYYKKGTPRFFQFKLTEEPIKLTPEGEVDGCINLVFSEGPKAIKKVEECSAECQEAIIYGHYKNTSEIRNLLYEIQKIKKVIDNNSEDKVAKKDLDDMLDHRVRLLNHHVLDNLYFDTGNVTWFYKGKKLKISNSQKFNQELSKICEDIYPFIPIYRNELINKTNISGQIAKARNILLKKLLNDLNKPNLGFQTNEFPPEKSIYLSLFKQTGIHQVVDDIGMLDQPEDASFNHLWTAGIKFLESSRQKEKTLEEFIQLLSTKPFKLKQGLIDLWVPFFLIAKADEFALYTEGTYTPEIESDIVDLMNKKPAMFSIKAFDVAGIKLQLFNRYRILLNQPENSKPSNKAFIQAIKPFLTFYKELPEYSKRTGRLDKKTLALRQVIAIAKDPEKVFFEDFPSALGFTLSELQKNQQQAENFIHRLQDSIKELRSSYDDLVDRFEHYLVKDVIGSNQSFPSYRDEIRSRFHQIKSHLLLAHQKPFYTRLQSELDDKKAWLSSIAQSCIGKPLSTISDEEEVVLFDKLKDLIYELDNLSDISEINVDDTKEEVLKLEVTSLVKGINKSLLRIPKEKMKEVAQKQEEIKRILGNDKKVNLAILAQLLQELI